MTYVKLVAFFESEVKKVIGHKASLNAPFFESDRKNENLGISDAFRAGYVVWYVCSCTKVLIIGKY